MADLAAQLKPFTGLHVIVGHPLRDAERAQGHGNANAPIERGVPPVDTFNAASLLVDGKVAGTYRKQDLPNTEVFDEKRYFAADAEPFVFELDGVKYGVVICEDAWHASAAQMAKAAGAQVLADSERLAVHLNKEAVRFDILRARIRETGLPMVYVNMVGAQDELVFDGGSFVLDAQGELVAKMPQFEEATAIVEFDGAPSRCQRRDRAGAVAGSAGLRGARDGRARLRRQERLSRRAASACRAASTRRCAGDRVRRARRRPRARGDDAVALHRRHLDRPTPREMARRVGVRYDEIAIEPMFDAFRGALAQEFAGRAEDATEENIQARIRGTL